MLNALLLAVNLGEVSGSFFTRIFLALSATGCAIFVATGDGQAAPSNQSNEPVTARPPPSNLIINADDGSFRGLPSSFVECKVRKSN